MTPRDDDAIRCPRCGAADIRKSLSKSLLDHVPGLLGFTALRCRSCRNRFYRRIADEGDAEGSEPR